MFRNIERHVKYNTQTSMLNFSLSTPNFVLGKLRFKYLKTIAKSYTILAKNKICTGYIKDRLSL